MNKRFISFWRVLSLVSCVLFAANFGSARGMIQSLSQQDDSLYSQLRELTKDYTHDDVLNKGVRLEKNSILTNEQKVKIIDWFGDYQTFYKQVLTNLEENPEILVSLISNSFAKNPHLMYICGSKSGTILGLLIQYRLKNLACYRTDDFDMMLRAWIKLSSKANAINLRSYEQQSPLHIACADSGAAVVGMLLKYSAEVNVKDAYNKAPLHYALEIQNCNERFSVVHSLVRAGADVNIAGGILKCTPLHMACGPVQLSLVQLLVENGAKVDSKDTNGQAPLDYLVEVYSKKKHTGKVKINGGFRSGEGIMAAEFLVQKGAVTEQGFTLAKERRNLFWQFLLKGTSSEGVEAHKDAYLIQLPLELLHKIFGYLTFYQREPLAVASKDLYYRVNMYERTRGLDRGALQAVRDFIKGKPSRDEALQKLLILDPYYLSMLCEHDSSYSNLRRAPVHRVVYRCDDLHKFVERGADLTVRDSEGAMPLHYVCSLRFSKEILELFLEQHKKNGLPLSARDKRGRTPLHMVTIPGDLIGGGSIYMDGKLSDRDGNVLGKVWEHGNYTAGHWRDESASEYIYGFDTFFENLSLMDSFLQAVSLDAQDEDGNTPLHYLMGVHQYEVVKPHAWAGIANQDIYRDFKGKFLNTRLDIFVEHFLKYKPNVMLKNKKGESVLPVLLLRYGLEKFFKSWPDFNVNQIGDAGGTPLDHFNEFVEKVESPSCEQAKLYESVRNRLLEGKANVSLKDNDKNRESDQIIQETDKKVAEFVLKNLGLGTINKNKQLFVVTASAGALMYAWYQGLSLPSFIPSLSSCQSALNSLYGKFTSFVASGFSNK